MLAFMFWVQSISAQWHAVIPSILAPYRLLKYTSHVKTAKSKKLSFLPPLAIFYIWTIFGQSHLVSRWNEAHKPQVKNVLFIARRGTAMPRPKKFWLDNLCPQGRTQASCSAQLFSQRSHPHGSAPPVQSLARSSLTPAFLQQKISLFLDPWITLWHFQGSAWPWGSKAQHLPCVWTPASTFIKKIIVCPVQKTWLMAGSEKHLSTW